jgi:hypothetical protein
VKGHTVILSGPVARERAKLLIDRAPEGFVATVSEPRRTLDQNAMLWAILTDISVSMPEGRRHTPEDWKAILMNACGWEVQFIEGLDGRPFPSGFRSSRMTKRQMADLITFALEYGDRHGVRWSDPQQEAA